jgi:hypothetical protein
VKKRVLLGFAESMDLIDKKNGPAIEPLPLFLRTRDDFPHVFHSRGDGAELLEFRIQVGGENASEGCLPHPRRTPENDRGDLPFFEENPEGTTGCENMRLTDDLLECGGA